MTTQRCSTLKILGVILLTGFQLGCGGASSGGDIAKTPPTQRTPEPTVIPAPIVTPEPSATPPPTASPNPPPPLPTLEPTPEPTPGPTLEPTPSPSLSIFDSDARENTVLETREVGLAVGISAALSDSVDAMQVEYRLQNNAFFSINSATGVVTNKAPLDYETKARHDLVVLASLPDGTVLSQDFQVEVRNKLPPVISRPQSFIYELGDAPGVDLLGTVFDPEGDALKLRLELADQRFDIAVNEADGSWFMEDIVLDDINRRLSLVAVDESTGEESAYSFVLDYDDTSRVSPSVLMYDAVADQTLVFDSYRASLSALSLENGDTNLLSYPAKPGPAIFEAVGAALDSSNRRVLVIDRRRDELISVDLATGVRASLGSAGSAATINGYRAITVDDTNNRALVFAINPLRVFAFDLSNGAKTTVFAMEGDDHPFYLSTAIKYRAASHELFVLDAFPGHTHINVIDLLAGEIVASPVSFAIEDLLDDPRDFYLSDDGEQLYFPGNSSLARVRLGALPATDVEVINLSSSGSQALSLALDEAGERVFVRDASHLFVASLDDGAVASASVIDYLAPRIESGKTYKIVNKASGRALEVPAGTLDEGASVGTFPFSNRAAWHKWVLSWEGDSYAIRAQHSELALNISGGINGRGNAIQWPYNGERNARWRLVAKEGGYFEIISLASGQVLDEELPTNNVTQFRRNNQDNQRWYFEALGNP